MERESPIVGQEKPTETQIYAHPNTDRFYRTAIAEGAHLKIPPKTRPKDWVRQMNMLATYLRTDNTFSDIAEAYGVIRQSPQQMAQRGLKNLWNSCSEETKKLFPLEEIPLGKPMSQKTREKLSAALGGGSLDIAALIEEGKTYEEIQEETGLTGRKLRGFRAVLRGWGVEVPYNNTLPERNRKLAERLNEEDDDREIQKLLGQVKIHFYRVNSRGENPLFISR